MKIKDINRRPKHMTTIGGQAVIEGVMMRGPKDLAVAIRRPDGEIELKKEDLNTLAMRYKIFKLPFLRGVVGLGESLMMGTRILTYSASFYDEEEDLGKEGFLDRIFRDRKEDLLMTATVGLSLLISVLIFMILPNFITGLFSRFTTSPMLLNLIEGLIRMSIFSIYLVLVSQMEDIQRVFQYHGAEHKSIHCYENGLELKVENARIQPGLHPRCGTSFLFMVMIISIVVLSFFGWPNLVARLGIRLVMLPLIAGIAYEINRIIGRSDSSLAYYISYPGLMIQKFATIREPDDQQLEVALVALRAVITNNEEDDRW